MKIPTLNFQEPEKLKKALKLLSRGSNTQSDLAWVFTMAISQDFTALDPLFQGYWNGDFEQMRITETNIIELYAKGISAPNASPKQNAYYILIVRLSRKETHDLSVPPALVFIQLEDVIREEIPRFTSEIRRILRSIP
ncbi:MAG: hypothetical protein EXS30_11890 [Pedosphaera sp.]|nr:hypothetical protein [Pedosphaera sp.]